MKWITKLHTEATKVVEDATHKIMAIQEWKEEGKRRFGKDHIGWKFECLMRGYIASTRDSKEAGAKGPNYACQKCLGGYTGKGVPEAGNASDCNWAAYGFSNIPDGKGITVLDEEGIEAKCFAFAGQEV